MIFYHIQTYRCMHTDAYAHTPTLLHIHPHLPAHTHTHKHQRTRVWCNSVCSSSLFAVKAGIRSRLNLKFEFMPSLAAKVVHKDLAKLVWEPLPGSSHLRLLRLMCWAGDTFDSTASHLQPENLQYMATSLWNVCCCCVFHVFWGLVTRLDGILRNSYRVYVL